jgi:hypothetical protein
MLPKYAANEASPKDLEAARPASSTSTTPTTDAEDSSLASETKSSQTLPQEYAHMGRGGAGNWFSPKDLNESGNFVTTDDPSATAKAEKVAQTEIVSETRHRGRGGAGNFIWSQEDEERSKRESEDKEIELKEMVARDVEAGLSKPGRAFLYSNERGEWDD